MGEKSRFVAIFAALLAAAFHVTSAKPEAKQVTHSIADKESKGQPADQRLLKTFADFDKKNEYRTPLVRHHGCFVGLNLPARPTNWVIATVPDPERSNLKLGFDREIEAIQNAAEGAGYQFERFWFPWRVEAAAALSERDSDDRVVGRDEVPGVLLFRPSINSDLAAKDLVVLLVGETPTSGINPGQFRYAECLGASLSNSWTDESPLLIIGPGYSASFDSLATLSGRHELVVRSWTSDLASQKHFAALPDRKVDLKTSLASSAASIDSFVTFLRKRWHDNSPIVLIKEEGTALGSGVKASAVQAADAKDDGAKNGSELKAEDKKVFTVQFPRNLSALRNASESQSRNASAGDEMPRIGLPLSLKEEQTSFEIPRFAVEQTPVSQESQLFSIAALLKTGLVHYTGIIASDPLDELYLTRYLHSACPNLRLFTLDPDLLLEHGSDSNDFQGVFAVSTYPLIPMSQIWTGGRKDLHIFPSRGFEATYNAVLGTLSAFRVQNDTPLPYSDFRDPFAPKNELNASLPLWLTIAGRTGFEPVAMLDSPKTPLMMTPIPGKDSRFAPVYWQSWGYCFYFILAICGLYCCALCFASPEGRRMLALFAVKPREQSAASRALYLVGIGATLSLLAVSWLVVPGEILVENYLASDTSPFTLKLAALLLFSCGGFLTLAGFSITRARRCGVPAMSKVKSFKGFVQAPGSSSTASALVSCFLLVLVPTSLPQARPLIMEHMLHMFLAGSFVLGAVLVAALCPVWDLRACPALTSRSRAAKVIAVDVGDPANLMTLLVSLSAMAITVTTYALFLIRRRADAEAFLQAFRALDLTSGVSALLPASLLTIVLISLGVVHLQRLVYYEDRCPTAPELPDDLFCPRLPQAIAETTKRTNHLALHHSHLAAVLALAVFGVGLLHDHSQQTLEGNGMELFLLGGSTLAGFFLLLVWVRVLLIWSAFSEFLQQLERHPLRSIFSLLPRGFVWSPVWQGGGKKRTHVAVTRSLECILALRSHPRTPARLKQVIETRIDRFQVQVKDLLEISASRRRIPLKLFRQVENDLSDIATIAARQLERDKWMEGGYELKAELATKENTKEALRMDKDRYHQEEPATICGELIAYRFLAFINYVLWQLDNLVGVLSFGFLLLVIALNCYAFRSETIINWALVAMFVVLTSGIMAVFAQADRDAILSRITGTKEGKLDKHFFIHLVSYGGMPVLVLAATHFPTIGRFFFSWVKPALEAVH